MIIIMIHVCRVRIAAVNFKNKQLLLEMISLPVSKIIPTVVQFAAICTDTGSKL